MFKTKILNILGASFLFTAGGVIGYWIADYGDSDPAEEGQFSNPDAAAAIASKFTTSNNKDRMMRNLLNRKVRRFYSDKFICVKFTPAFYSYAYTHVACDFGNNEIEVYSF